MREKKIYLGYQIVGAENLSKERQKEFDTRFVSLLNTLGTLKDLSYFTWACEFRWNVVPNLNSAFGKKLEQYILLQLSSEERSAASLRQGLLEIDAILTTTFIDFGIETSSVDVSELEQRRSILIPFDVANIIELHRFYKTKPFEISAFKTKTDPPSLSKILDLLFRSKGSTSLSVFCEPYVVSDGILDEFEAFDYTKLEGYKREDRKSDDIGDRSFRAKIRLLTEESRVSVFVTNAIFSAITGGARFHTFEVPDEIRDSELNKIAHMQWSEQFLEADEDSLPNSLKSTLPILRAAELNRAIRFPAERMPGIRFRYFRYLSPPVELLPAKGLLLGLSRSPSSQDPIKVRIRTEDRRRHSYIIGKTGTGKSSFLLSMILADAESGKGLAVIDPHGDLIEKIILRLPEERVGDVILFDTSDLENPPGLNILEGNRDTDARLRDYIISEANEFFLKLYGNEIFGPRIQDYFRNACLTLMDTKAGGTIVDVPRLFLDEEFKNEILKDVREPVARAFWDNQMAQTALREKKEMIPYFSAKFTPFVASTVLRPIVGRKTSTVNFKQLIEEGKILLANLSKGVLGSANMSLLGTILVSRLVWTAFERARLPESSRRDFFLYIDEFQNFVGQDIATILSEARKYRLNLILAHQYISQLGSRKDDGPRSVRQAVFGNVGSQFVFRVGRGDAEILSKELDLGDGMISDLCNLSNYNLYNKILVNGEPLRAFSLETIDIESQKTECLDKAKKIRVLSRKGEVEQ